MYKCKPFKIHELVPLGIHRKRGEQAWQLLDEKALITLDLLREKFGSAIVNDCKRNGTYKYRGFRPASCNVGSKLSQHRRRSL